MAGHSQDGVEAIGLADNALGKELGNAQLVTTRHEGRFIYCSANFATMNGLLAYLTENCCGSGTAFVPFCEPIACQPPREEESV
jgi:hypothetical protein